jgi:hypothetical protein
MNTLVQAGLLCAVAACCVPGLSLQDSSPAEAPSRQSPETITIPDGARLEVRLTQPLHGPVSYLPWLDDATAAKPLDTVPLVAAQNLYVDGHLVIARGSIGQATVTNSYVPYRNPKYPDIDTGLDLRLDWIESITGEKVSLRAFAKGKPKAFHVLVFSFNTGHIARPDTLRHQLLRAMTLNLGTLREEMHRRDWVPAGTRMTAFVQGPVHLDGASVDEVREQLPATDSQALLTIYRTKDRRKDLAGITCDGAPMSRIGRRQYIVLEFAPGTHSCRVETEQPIQLIVKPGEDYFILVRPRLLTAGWELKQVSPGEGEDGTSASEMVIK